MFSSKVAITILTPSIRDYREDFAVFTTDTPNLRNNMTAYMKNTPQYKRVIGT